MYPTTQQPDTHQPQEGTSARDRFLQKAEAELEEWSTRVDQLASMGERLTDDAKVKTERRLAELKEKLGAARERLQASKAARNEKWDEAKAALESYWDEVKALFAANETTHPGTKPNPGARH